MLGAVFAWERTSNDSGALLQPLCGGGGPAVAFYFFDSLQRTRSALKPQLEQQHQQGDRSCVGSARIACQW